MRRAAWVFVSLSTSLARSASTIERAMVSALPGRSKSDQRSTPLSPAGSRRRCEEQAARGVGIVRFRPVDELHDPIGLRRCELTTSHPGGRSGRCRVRSDPSHRTPCWCARRRMAHAEGWRTPKDGVHLPGGRLRQLRLRKSRPLTEQSADRGVLGCMTSAGHLGDQLGKRLPGLSLPAPERPAPRFWGQDYASHLDVFSGEGQESLARSEGRRHSYSGSTTCRNACSNSVEHLRGTPRDNPRVSHWPTIVMHFGHAKPET